MLHITVACYFSTPNLAPFLKAQALNLTPFLKAQALNLALLSKAQALNLALTPFTYPIFKHKLSKVSKNIKPTSNLINKELRRSKVKPCRAP